MNTNQKHECYENALKALPNKLSIKDLLVFIYGLCDCFDTDPELIALGLLATNPSDEESARSIIEEEELKINFKDEKLQQLLGGGAD
jgi:hypothetical protein